MAPCHSLWATKSPFSSLPKVLQEPAVETSGCAFVHLPLDCFCPFVDPCCAGYRASGSSETPFTIPQNRVPEGLASPCLSQAWQSSLYGLLWKPQASSPCPRLLGSWCLQAAFL